MGSLNDYGRWSPGSEGRGRPRRSWRWRLLGQSLGALAFFLLIAACVSGQGALSSISHYVLGPGLAVESSWVEFSDVAAVSAPVSGAAETVPAPAPVVPQSAEDGPPAFTAPASGVVVTELAVPASGFATDKGILIQGSSGQKVKAAAAGTVRYLGSNEQGYIVELTHSGGFSSVYQGLSELSVGSGDTLSLGQPLGLTADGEVTFSLFVDGQEVSPLDYLFDS